MSATPDVSTGGSTEVGNGSIIKAIRRRLRPLRRGVRQAIAILAHCRGGQYCPCCKHRVKGFINWRDVPLESCPLCGSARRYRMLTVFLPKHTDIMTTSGKMLHIAPERSLGWLLKRNPRLKRTTADLLRDDVDAKVDICNIQFPDNSFDYVMCNHVLEHVPDDRKAMRELRRVLRPDGIAILQSPITVDATFEDPSITDPQERLRLFFQEDHVRVYGPDYVQRLESSGFIVKALAVTKLFGPDQIQHCGFDPEELVYVCLKSQAGNRRLTGVGIAE